jgi:hypothetical protein
MIKKQRLSSSATFFWKFIFSGLWLGFFSIGTIFAIYDLGFEGLFMLVVLLFGAAMLYYGTLRAKNVYTDANKLYVDNFFKKIEIPLDQVESVEENRLFTPRPAWIHLKTGTEFGNSIMFITRFKTLFFEAHPDIERVRNLLRKTTHNTHI